MSANDTDFSDARAKWDKRFSTAGFWFGEQPNAFLQREAARLRPAAEVLSVADGEGRNAIHLAERGHRPTAFDLSPVAVEKARRWALERGVQVDFRLGEVDTWNWTPAAFDAVVAIFVQFAGPAMRKRLFEGMWRTLKPGGLLLMQGYTPKQLEYGTGGPGKLDHLYTPQMLRDLLPQAQWLLLSEHEEELEEGRGHVGRSALIDAVALKPRAGASEG